MNFAFNDGKFGHVAFESALVQILLHRRAQVRPALANHGLERLQVGQAPLL